MTENPHVLIEYVPVPDQPGQGGFRWTIQGQMPSPLLVNMLELIKTTLVHQQLAMAQAAARVEPGKQIVLPNGPVPHFPLDRG